MKHFKPDRLWGLITAAAILFTAPVLVHAAGTPSGTTVSNTANVSYTVGGVAQTPLASTPVTFVVDNRVDLTVAEVGAGPTTGAPGQTAVVTTFTVTNVGNTVQDYALSAANVVGGTLFPVPNTVTDNVDVTITGVFVESGANAGYQAAEDTAAFIDELAADASATVYVVATIPAALVDADGAIVSLTATTANGGTAAAQGATTTATAGADTPGSVDVVLADGTGSDDAANDGAHSARDAYLVGSAALTVSKTSAVVSDPVNLAVNPKAIPGATMRYTITVTNNGGTAATSVTLRDAIPGNTTYAVGSITLNAGGLTDAGDADAGDYNVSNAGEVTVVIGNLAASGGTATVTFDVTIN